MNVAQSSRKDVVLISVKRAAISKSVVCKYEYHPFTRLKALGFEILVYLIFLAKARTRYHGARAGNHGLGSKQTSVPVFHIKLFRRNFIQTSVNCLKSKYEKRYGCPTLSNMVKH